MRWMLLTLLVACAGGDDAVDTAAVGTGTGTGTGAGGGTGGGAAATSDPDVNSYVPDGWKATSPVRVVYLGDSITAGAGATSRDLAYTELLAEDTSGEWPDHADADLESLFGGLEVVDVSEGGATTDTLVANQLPNLADTIGGTATGETIIVLTIGGNDAQGALNPLANPRDILQNALDNVEYMVDDLQGMFPDGAYIYLTNVYEPTDGTGSFTGCFFGIDFSDRYDDLYWMEDELRAMAADKGFAALDLRGHFEGHGFHAEDSSIDAYHADDPTIWFDDDCIHPNDRGHHEIRRLFHAAIQGVDLPLE